MTDGTNGPTRHEKLARQFPVVVVLALLGAAMELVGCGLGVFPGVHLAVGLAMLVVLLAAARIELAWARSRPDPTPEAKRRLARFAWRGLLAITAIQFLVAGASRLPEGIIMWILGGALLLYAIKRGGI